MTKNKINGLLGQCEDRIEQYFSRLFFSLAADSYEDVLYRFNKNYSSETITDMLK